MKFLIAVLIASLCAVALADDLDTYAVDNAEMDYPQIGSRFTVRVWELNSEYSDFDVWEATAYLWSQYYSVVTPTNTGFQSVTVLQQDDASNTFGDDAYFFGASVYDSTYDANNAPSSATWADSYFPEIYSPQKYAGNIAELWSTSTNTEELDGLSYTLKLRKYSTAAQANSAITAWIAYASASLSTYSGCLWYAIVPIDQVYDNAGGTLGDSTWEGVSFITLVAFTDPVSRDNAPSFDNTYQIWVSKGVVTHDANAVKSIDGNTNNNVNGDVAGTIIHINFAETPDQSS